MHGKRSSLIGLAETWNLEEAPALAQVKKDVARSRRSKDKGRPLPLPLQSRRSRLDIWAAGTSS